MSVNLRMLRTVPGSVNGRDVRTYEAGQCYELPDDGPAGLAGVFLREGWAARVAPEPVEAAPEKPVEAAPEKPVRRSRKRVAPEPVEAAPEKPVRRSRKRE